MRALVGRRVGRGDSVDREFPRTGRREFSGGMRGGAIVDSGWGGEFPGWRIRKSLGDAKSSLGDAKSSLGDAKSSLGDAESSLGDAKSSLGDATSSLGDAKS
jgi:hypothetical protein